MRAAMARRPATISLPMPFICRRQTLSRRSRRKSTHGDGPARTERQMGWFSTWRNKVDIGLRPRQVFEGTEVNLYPFTKRGAALRANDHETSESEEFSLGA